MMNATFCPPNSTFVDVWVKQGVSKWLIENIKGSAIFLHLLIFAPIQIWMYNRYEAETSSCSAPKNNLYKFQKYLHYFILAINLFDNVLQVTILDGKPFHMGLVSILFNKKYFVKNC